MKKLIILYLFLAMFSLSCGSSDDSDNSGSNSSDNSGTNTSGPLSESESEALSSAKNTILFTLER